MLSRKDHALSREWQAVMVVSILCKKLKKQSTCVQVKKTINVKLLCAATSPAAKVASDGEK